MDLCVKRCVQTHLFLTANMSHSAFAESKTMETFRPDMSTYVKSCTRTRPRKSKWCRVISWSVVVVSRSSWSVIFRGQSVVLIVVVSRRGQLIFMLSLRSSWSSCSVVFRDQPVVLVVVVSRSSWSSWSVIFSWSVSRLNRCGQSSWSVVFRGQSFFLLVVVSRRGQSWIVFIFYGGYAHVFTET